MKAQPAADVEAHLDEAITTPDTPASNDGPPADQFCKSDAKEALECQSPPILGATDGDKGAMYDRRRVKAEPKGLALLFMSFRALGIIYGDIGTSPLYVINGIFPSDGPLPPQEDVIGIISCIFWIFTLVVVVKYCFIVLNFGTGEGEGGTFALYQGLFPRDQVDDEDANGARTRALTYVSTKSLHTDRHSDRRELLMRYSWVKPVLLGVALFGSALTLADGVMTPAVSVISAAEGLALVDTSLSRGDIDGISIAILLILLALQSFGVKKLGIFFSPAVLLWMMFLFVTGIINVTSFPGIFRAWDPSRAILYFVRTKNYDALSGILLAVTGTEALFAAIGQLSVRSIRWSLIAVVYPSLMLAYLGQGAKLIANPEAVLPNVFYLSVPGGQGSAAYWIGFVTGLLATVIASQALLSASFSIVSQLSHMRSLPPIRAIFTDENDMGPVYVPVANFALAIGIIIAVVAFKSSANLTNAYGFSVSSVMIVTCAEVALQIYFVKNKPWIVAVLFFVAFGFIDGLLWGASLKKIPHGAWFSLIIGLGLFSFMMFYSWASELVSNFDAANRIPLSNLLSVAPPRSPATGEFRPLNSLTEDEHEAALYAQAHDVDSDLILHSLDGSEKRVRRMPVAAVFWKTSGGSGVPHAFAHFLTKYPAVPQIVVFLSLRVLAVARIPRGYRIVVNKTRRYAGFYGVTLRNGYLDELDLQEFSEDLMTEILKLEKSIGPELNVGSTLRTRRAGTAPTSDGNAVMLADAQEEYERRLDAIRVAAESSITHVYPSYYVSARPLSGSLRFRETTASSKPAKEAATRATKVPKAAAAASGRPTTATSTMTTSSLPVATPPAAAKTSWTGWAKALPVTAADYIRALLLEEIFRRVKGVFTEEDGPFEAKEEIVRIQVSARL